MQDLDRRLEHLDEFEQALRRAVQPAAVGIGVRIGLAEVFELADIDLADQRRDVLVVFVARLGLGDADLAQPRRHQLDDAEFRDVAAELVKPLGRPWRDQAVQPAPRNPVFVLQEVGHALGMEEAKRRFEDRADLVADLQRVDRPLLHQLLQPLGQRRLAATDRAEQIEDLLALLEPLGSIAEIADDPLDRVLHAVEFGESRIDLDGPVRENSAETLVRAGVDQGRLADRIHHPLRRGGVHAIDLRGMRADIAGGSSPPAPHWYKSPKRDRKRQTLSRAL